MEPGAQRRPVPGDLYRSSRAARTEARTHTRSGDDARHRRHSASDAGLVRTQGSGLRAQGSGLKAQGSRRRAQGSGKDGLSANAIKPPRIISTAAAPLKKAGPSVASQSRTTRVRSTPNKSVATPATITTTPTTRRTLGAREI